ncbi:hypothetical protein DRQ25_07175 [Candidatus Fermentibacteria bacterium]|nr:MAG: hypothetical protein DRQ25_07175 [Candidatus Fermentibacteria bacterium]
MTKKKTEVKVAPQKYVVLRRISYKSMNPKERRIIDPAADPYAEDAPRVTFEHLSKGEVNKLVMMNIIAPEKQLINNGE